MVTVLWVWAWCTGASGLLLLLLVGVQRLLVGPASSAPDTCATEDLGLPVALHDAEDASELAA